MEAIKQEKEMHRKRVYNKLTKLPDENGLIFFISAMWELGQKTDKELKEGLKAYIENPKIKEIALKALEELEIIERIEDHTPNKYPVLVQDLKYGEDTLVPEGTEGRSIASGDGMLTVVIGDYGVIATLPEEQFKNAPKVPKEIFAYDYARLTEETRQRLRVGQCPICLIDGYGSGFLVGHGVGKKAMKVKILDNGDASVDRYTILSGGVVYGMGDNPSSPYVAIEQRKFESQELPDSVGIDQTDLFECLECGAQWDNLPIPQIYREVGTTINGIVIGAKWDFGGLIGGDRKGFQIGRHLPVIGLLKEGRMSFSITSPDGRQVLEAGLERTGDVVRWLEVHREYLSQEQEETKK